MPDTRVVYGVNCTWWDSIDKVAKLRTGIPCCPHCGSVLFEVANIEEWWEGVDRHDQTHPGYRKLIEWSQGKCYLNTKALITAYQQATSINALAV